MKRVAAQCSPRHEMRIRQRTVVGRENRAIIFLRETQCFASRRACRGKAIDRFVSRVARRKKAKAFTLQ